MVDKTVLDFPSLTYTENEDVSYSLRGTGTDRDKNIVNRLLLAKDRLGIAVSTGRSQVLTQDSFVITGNANGRFTLDIDLNVLFEYSSIPVIQQITAFTDKALDSGSIVTTGTNYLYVSYDGANGYTLGVQNTAPTGEFTKTLLCTFTATGTPGTYVITVTDIYPSGSLMKEFSDGNSGALASPTSSIGRLGKYLSSISVRTAGLVSTGDIEARSNKIWMSLQNPTNVDLFRYEDGTNTFHLIADGGDEGDTGKSSSSVLSVYKLDIGLGGADFDGPINADTAGNTLIRVNSSGASSYPLFRASEGTSWLGVYFGYDNARNLGVIGVHDTADSIIGNDVPAIEISRASGAATFLSQLSIDSDSLNRHFVLNGGPSNTVGIEIKRSDLAEWLLYDSGGDSSLALNRYIAGVSQGAVLTIANDTGKVRILEETEIDGELTCNSQLFYDYSGTHAMRTYTDSSRNWVLAPTDASGVDIAGAKFYWNSSGLRWQFQSSAPVHMENNLSITGQIQAYGQLISLLTSTNNTDNATKYSRIGSLHYDIDEEPVISIYQENNVSENIVRIGGGTASGNAITDLFFYLAQNNTTPAGGLRASMDYDVFRVYTDLRVGGDFTIEGGDSGLNGAVWVA